MVAIRQVWSDRTARGDASHDSELAAFCLRGMALLWRRKVGDLCLPQSLVIFVLA